MSDGGTFIVQTDLAFGDPSKGFTLRLYVQTPGLFTVQQVMARAVADGFIAGEHMDIRPGKATGEPIAVNLQRIVHIKRADVR